MVKPESSTASEPKTTTQNEPMTGEGGLRSMVREYYTPIYRLALASLQDAENIRRATVRTFAHAMLDVRHPHTSDSVRLRLFSLALKVIRAEKHRKGNIPAALTTPEDWEKLLWRMVDELGAKEHELCLLYYLLGCNVPEIASLLGVGQGAVRAQLDIFRGRFRQILGDKPRPVSAESPPPGITGPFPSSESAVQAPPSVETRVAESLRKRWPVPQLSSAELQQVIDHVWEIAESERLRRRQITPYKWIALAAGIMILAAICLIGGSLAWLASSNPAGGPGKINAWKVKSGLPLEKAKALSRSFDSETIRLRLKEGPLLWKTLWIDVQIIAYGPESYIGLPRIYRTQAWISQPDQSMELFGLLSQAPSSLHMVVEGREYYMNPTLRIARTEEWGGNPLKEYSGGKLLSNTALRNMVFPGSGDRWSSYLQNEPGIVGSLGSSWATGEGTIKTVKYDRIAKRRALVIDWMNPENEREARIWLDVQTGLVLHLQKFGGPDYQTITYESMVTEIAYNQPNPPPRFSEALQLEEPNAFMEWESFTVVKVTQSPTPTIALPLTSRPAMVSEPAPIGFDPSHSALVFQFPLDPGIMNSITNTAKIPTGLIADGYLLDVIQFGLPWVLRCERSPDGQRLAFNTGTDEIAPADDGLHWLNLKEPQSIYQPLPGLHATGFAFAPDSHRLAVFGYGEEPWKRGVYILDIGNGEYQFLMNLAYATSLVWSPDGQYLALIGSSTEEDYPTILVIHVDTAQIAYQGEVESLEGEKYVIGPMAGWEVEFPVEMGSMDQCAAPP